MPSSFTRVRSHALGCSPCPPVLVSGTVAADLMLRGFSWKSGVTHFASVEARARVSRLARRICLSGHGTRLNRDNQRPAWATLLRPPIAIDSGSGMLTGFPSATPFGLALGAGSPCADWLDAGTLGLPAGRVLTALEATHVSIRTSDTSSSPHGPPSAAYGTLPYPVLRQPRLRWMT